MDSFGMCAAGQVAAETSALMLLGEPDAVEARHLYRPESESRRSAGKGCLVSFGSGWVAIDDDCGEAPGDAPALDERNGAAGRPIGYRQSLTWFSPDIDFREPVGQAFVEAVIDLLPKQTGRGRRVRSADLRAYVRVILANGLRCYFHREDSAVAYNRSSERRGAAPEWPTGQAMARTTDKLAESGLLSLETGNRKASVYTVTDMLVRLAADCGVIRASLVRRLPPERLVRLFGPKASANAWGRRKRGEAIAYIETDQVRRWRDELGAYNTFLRQHDIGLTLTPEEEAAWALALNEDDEFTETPYKLPELLQTDIYRVFSNGNVNSAEQAFDQGGRLYGGWWINAPSRFRPRITIDGEPTVELDYSGYHINMLYHERGLECDGDPYTLPDLTAYEKSLGLPEKTYRPWVKIYTNALINCRKGGRPSNIVVDKDIPIPVDIRPIDALRMIEKRHEPIKDAFRSNAGLRLQRVDSGIALEIITTAMKAGWVALPVHDSFIARESDEIKLLILMNVIYHNLYKISPSIK